MLQAIATLLWIPQAFCLAWTIGALVDGADMQALWPAIIAFPVIGLFRAALDALGSRLIFRKARSTLSQIRISALRALSLTSPVDIQRPASGHAASVVAEQAETLMPYLTRYQPIQRKVMVVTPVILLTILPFSWVAALILLLSAPLIPLFMALIGLKAKEASEAQMLEIGGMNAFLLDRLRGLATIRAMGAVGSTALRLRQTAENLRSRTMSVLRIAFLSSAVLELFSALSVALVAVYVGFHFLGPLPFGAWGAKLSLTEGLFILLLAPAFFEPLRELSVAWHDRAAGIAALDALKHLSQPGELKQLGQDVIEGDTLKDLSGPCDVHTKNLSFAYSQNRPALTNFTFSIMAGERIALMGASGSGKSTLLALLAGLVKADAGQILIGGVPLTDQTAGSLRQHMAWISQKPHIFSGSIKSNIKLGRTGLGDTEVECAIELSAFTDVIHKRGSDISVGEGGSGLSGGEALRLALARAAANPLARLILADEPTAHLDPDTAAQVREGLLKLAQGRTLIVATHDPILANAMDRVIQLPLGEGTA